MGIHVSFRDVDTNAFREFKAVAAREGMKMGVALNTAFGLFAEKFRQKPRKKMGLMDLKPVSFGPGNERLSERVDEFLYGWKR